MNGQEVEQTEEGHKVNEDIELEDDQDREDQEKVEVKTLRSPSRPTQAEVDEHNVSHIPFRDWCPFCVQGAAPNRHHSPMGNQEYQIPHIACDYCFLGDEGQGEDKETLIVQVAVDLNTRCVFAHAVPRKGAAHEHGADEVCRDIEALGYRDIVFKTDNEPAMRTLQEEVRSRRVARTVLETHQ